MLLLLVLASPIHAGRNADGALIVHTNDLVSYTTSGDYCGVHFNDPGTCENASTRTDKDEEIPAVIWLLAAFPDTSSPEVAAIQFGIEHNLPAEQGYFTKFKMCADLEMPDAGWPETGFGNLVSFGSSAQTELLFPFYFFAVYGFEGAYFGTAVYPSTEEAKFVDESEPPVEDLATRFGTVRWFATGSNDCPGEQGEEEDAPPEGEEDSDEDEQLEDTLGSRVVDPSRFISAWIEDDEITFDAEESRAVPLSLVSFSHSATKDSLLGIGVRAVQKTFAGTTPADTLKRDINGDLVRTIDVSGFYDLVFDDSEDAASALPVIRTNRRFKCVAHEEVSYYTSSQPEDPLFSTWPACPNAYSGYAQWSIENSGTRGGTNQCGQARAGYDINVVGIPGWPPTTSTREIIGVIDVGIRDDHEDLLVLNGDLSLEEQAALQFRPGFDDFCGSHGTKMAGHAAAIANNEKGIAGVNSACRVLDINAASCAVNSCNSVPQIENEGISSWWSTGLEKALAMNLPGTIVAFNCSFGGYGHSGVERLVTLWNAHQQKVLVVAASMDTSWAVPKNVAPANVPWVLSVGGMSQDGRFWESATSCDPVPGKGTTVGPSCVDICAPASGSLPMAFITDNPNCPDLHLPYASGHAQCSGAAAMVTGAAAYIQKLARADPRTNHRYLAADDIAGMLTASALPFAEEPPVQPPLCPDCPREWYGSGRLNVAGAVELLDMYLNGRVIERVARYGDPHVIQWNAGIDECFGIGAEVWCRVKVTMRVALPGHDGGSGLPNYCAWVQRGTATTFERYFDQRGWGHVEQIDAMNRGLLRGCEMGIINQAMGTVDLVGYCYGRYDEGLGDYVWMGGFDPSNAAMPYMVVRSIGTADAEEERRLPSRNMESPVLCAPRFPWTDEPLVSFILPVTSTARLSVLDASGRMVRMIAEGAWAAGTHAVAWDGRDAQGHRLPSGVYWLSLRTPAGSASRQLVIIR